MFGTFSAIILLGKSKVKEKSPIERVGFHGVAGSFFPCVLFCVCALLLPHTIFLHTFNFKKINNILA